MKLAELIKKHWVTNEGNLVSENWELMNRMNMLEQGMTKRQKSFLWHHPEDKKKKKRRRKEYSSDPNFRPFSYPHPGFPM